MKTEIKILKFLLAEDKSLTIREVSQKTKLDYKIVHTAIKELVKKRLLESKPVGKSIQLTLKRIYSKEIFEAETERKEELLKDKNLKVLHDHLLDLPFQFIVLVFGSYTKGTYTKKSDIDLMIIAPEENKSKINSRLSVLPLDIHPTFLDYKDFLQMKNSKDFSVVSEAIKNNIIIINIEDYYRILNNAR
ncbi:nucleotidyltransferase domain-containing protein [Candidatus Pacearchaeota archaeon]|nr:nucleotidyltransferase domain-containing protein [Candidatus Pacearchaeota archaeon]